MKPSMPGQTTAQLRAFPTKLRIGRPMVARHARTRRAGPNSVTPYLSTHSRLSSRLVNTSSDLSGCRSCLQRARCQAARLYSSEMEPPCELAERKAPVGSRRVWYWCSTPARHGSSTWLIARSAAIPVHVVHKTSSRKS